MSSFYSHATRLRLLALAPRPPLHSFLVPTPPLDGLQEELLQKLEEARVALEETRAVLKESDAMLRSTIAALRLSVTPYADDLVMQVEGEEEPGVMMEKIEESEVQESRPLLWRERQNWPLLAAIFIAYIVVGHAIFSPFVPLIRAH